jgi:hypothetical protein
VGEEVVAVERVQMVVMRARKEWQRQESSLPRQRKCPKWLPRHEKGVRVEALPR